MTHERELRLLKDNGALEIVDRLTGTGAHQFLWHFHLAPGVDASVAGETMIHLSARGRQWTLRLPAGLHASIAKAEYSPSYGAVVTCAAIDLTASVVLDGTRSWEFSIT